MRRLRRISFWITCRLNRDFPCRCDPARGSSTIFMPDGPRCLLCHGRKQAARKPVQP